MARGQLVLRVHPGPCERERDAGVPRARDLGAAVAGRAAGAAVPEDERWDPLEALRSSRVLMNVFRSFESNNRCCSGFENL